jgi:LEM3 (ligand-effect modulator 3) family / CDC50 family
VKSRNDQQLRDSKEANTTSYCDPEKTTADGKPIVPCGLIAWSLFNDTYTFSRGSENITVNRKHISWKSDRDHKFGKDVYPRNFQNGTLIGGGKLDSNVPVCCVCVRVGGLVYRLTVHVGYNMQVPCLAVWFCVCADTCVDCNLN